MGRSGCTGRDESRNIFMFIFFALFAAFLAFTPALADETSEQDWIFQKGQSAFAADGSVYVVPPSTENCLLYRIEEGDN